MESIYYAICWHCHRRCKHCYDARFKPYISSERDDIITRAQQTSLSVIKNLPEHLGYQYTDSSGQTHHAPSRIILSGGEVLTDSVREPILYPLLEQLQDKYERKNCLKIIIQTTGDLINEQITKELMGFGVWFISISGYDQYHTGMSGARGKSLIDNLHSLFQNVGVTYADNIAQVTAEQSKTGPFYSIFGANPDSWIGKLWPRGRAWENSLCNSQKEDNFCNAWSGGLNFLNIGKAGSEISIDPDGNLYPCCIKTAEPLGNLTEESLTTILEDVQQESAFKAINEGQPQQMGLSYGWDESQFLAASKTQTPDGGNYTNLCIGCDQFHNNKLSSILRQRRQRRLSLSLNRIICEDIS